MSCLKQHATKRSISNICSINPIQDNIFSVIVGKYHFKVNHDNAVCNELLHSRWYQRYCTLNVMDAESFLEFHYSLQRCKFLNIMTMVQPRGAFREIHQRQTNRCPSDHPVASAVMVYCLLFVTHLHK